jgi:hypothetical protein
MCARENGTRPRGGGAGFGCGSIGPAMLRATLIVVDGVPFAIEDTERFHPPALIPQSTSLRQFLRNLSRAGWQPEGDLPRHRSSGVYKIRLVEVRRAASGMDRKGDFLSLHGDGAG